MDASTIFSGISSLAELTGVARSRTDNLVFGLHYRLSTVILLAFALVICSRKYFGTPMTCLPRGNETVQDGINSYCWKNSYLVLPRDSGNEQNIYKGRFHPAWTDQVDNLKDMGPDSQFRPYYVHVHQWIEFIIIFQAALCFLPRFLWRYCLEDDRINNLKMSIKQSTSMVSLNSVESGPAQLKEKSFQKIVFFLRNNRTNHKLYAFQFLFCEFLNFVVALIQLAVLHSVCTVSYPNMWANFVTTRSNRIPEGPLHIIFPNMVRCQVPTPVDSYKERLNGPSWCMITINGLITKMYPFLCYYFLILTLITGAYLLFFRVVTVFTPKLRLYLLRNTGGGLPEDYADDVRYLNYGEWFLLTVLRQSVDPFAFQDFLVEYGDSVGVPDNRAESSMPFLKK